MVRLRSGRSLDRFFFLWILSITSNIVSRPALLHAVFLAFFEQSFAADAENLR